MILKRIAIGFSLILILLVLCLYYNHYHESTFEYPSTDTILSNYPEGSTVSVSGTALRQTSYGFDLLDKNGKTEYKIISSHHINPADNIQLIGVLEPNYTIKCTKMVIETEWSYEFVIQRSALALIFLIFIFFRYLKFDFRTLEFIRLRKPRFSNHKNKKFLRRQ